MLDVEKKNFIYLMLKQGRTDVFIISAKMQKYFGKKKNFKMPSDQEIKDYVAHLQKKIDF